jgi:BTB And C-terminal Kelch
VKSFDGLLQQKEFLAISQNALRFLVEQNFLTQCNEVALIEAVEDWANFHLQKSDIEINHENLRCVLGEAVVCKLRYLSLSQGQLVYLFKKTDLLSKEEKLNLHEWFVTKNSNALMDSLSSHKYSRWD